LAKTSKHTVADGFGNMWQCVHGLSKEWCCLAVMRPGKVQCACDGGLADLLEYHYERGRDHESESCRIHEENNR
jgi:hypothetical protein